MGRPSRRNVVLREPPGGYVVRQYEPSDSDAYSELFHLAFTDDLNLDETVSCALDEGFFVVEHVDSGQLVSSCIAGEGPPHVAENKGRSWLGWLVTDIGHGGRGLGTLVSGLVTNTLLTEGHHPLSLGTEDDRLAAISIYLKAGWKPDLYADCMASRWGAIFGQLDEK